MTRISSGQSLGERERQEDALRIVHQSDHADDSEVLMILSDGMGGHAGGDIASNLAIEAFIDHFQNVSENMRPNGRLEDSIHAANAALKQRVESQAELRGMGCTFLAVLIVQERMFWCSVGDSILFHLRNGQIRRLSADHSYFGELLEMVRRGETTLEEARAHPSKNALRSAVTGEPLTLIDNNSVQTLPSDIVLLASDGIETLSDDEIATVIYRHTKAGATDIAAALLDEVALRNRPRQDNTSLIVYKENGETKETTMGDRKWSLPKLPPRDRVQSFAPVALLAGAALAVGLILFALFSPEEVVTVIPETVVEPPAETVVTERPITRIDDSSPIEGDIGDDTILTDPIDPIDANPAGESIEDDQAAGDEAAIDEAVREALESEADTPSDQDVVDPVGDQAPRIPSETRPVGRPDVGDDS